MGFASFFYGVFVMDNGCYRINGRICTTEQLGNREFLLSLSAGDLAFADFMLAWLDGNDYVVGFTSGSTGDPKRILLSKGAMRASAERTNAFFGMGAGSSILLCLSANYIAGKMMIVRALVGHMDLFLEKPSSLPLSDGGCYDLVSMVPMQIYSLRSSGEGERRLRGVRNLLVGGGALAADDADWLRSLPLRAFVSYGMTETVSHVALASLEERRADGELVYHALPSVRFSRDGRGCLVVDAPYLSSDSFVTNDVVQLITQTSFVWCGRWDNVINTGGVKVHPEVMERKVSGMVRGEFYFTSEPDAKFGQRVVLVIEGSPYPTGTLLRLLQTRLSPYEMPKVVRFVDGFERTESGKVKRR